MALIAATALHPGDYFAINTPPAVFANLGMPIVNLAGAAERRSARPSSAGPAARCRWRSAWRRSSAACPGMRGLLAYWYHFAIMFEALFILTTIDSGTRVGRFLLQEFVGRVWKPFARHRLAAGRADRDRADGAGWGYFIYTGNINTIWPMFGVANQLLASSRWRSARPS